MRLLVSVRSGAEVEPALVGGADIVDAKEPSRGSLGPVSPRALAGILANLPSSRSLSVALGDVTTGADIAAAMAALRLPPRQAPTFLKLGFAGVSSREIVRSLLAGAVQLAAARSPAPLIIAVAYADRERARTLSPELIRRLACEAGAAGILIDTYRKDGAGLLKWLSPAALSTWVAQARRAGLLVAVAGALTLDDLDPVAAAAPDIIGFRGAACDGGRAGAVSAERVAGLRRQIDLRSRQRPRVNWPPPRGTSQNALSRGYPALLTGPKSRRFNG